MQKKLLAVAVATAVAAPATVFAASHSGPSVAVSGRVAVAVTASDNGEDTTWDIGNVGSRFRVLAVSEDLGNGMEAYAGFEFGVTADRSDIQANNRYSQVGLKGAFGDIRMGRSWGAEWAAVGTYMEISNLFGLDVWSGAGGVFRKSNQLQYRNSFGAVSAELDLGIDGGNTNEDGVDETALGINFGGGAVDGGLLIKNVSGAAGASDIDQVGIGLGYSSGNLFIRGGYLQSDNGSPDDRTGIALYIGGSSGQIRYAAGIGQLQDDDDNLDTDSIYLYLANHFSKRTRVFVEASNQSPEAGDDLMRIAFAIRHDF